ncbi:MAG TPA: hypothetical protein DEF21_04065 [Thalassospira lucentensis]|uniref:Uncharacterized protein n=1 Tax=Thalassospira lucentensis TaxID=168935 RepID=A0A358HPF2_9PROT|nr:hypothetical protein [Thalassospira lucentensis]HCW67783.1 hypothetical protein [Thalassospira lucentensis]
MVDVSPYLLTFMAFVPGFMAKDAFNRIQDARRKLFRGRSTASIICRWIFPVAEARQSYQLT